MQGMTAIARLGAVSLDAPDPARLARFYQEALDLQIMFENDSVVAPTKPATQPAPDRWRVLIDPAGHPFCITTLIPEA